MFRSLAPGSTNPRVPPDESVPLFKVRWLRIFYRMCIAYAFRPELSSRLTLGGRTFPKKPQIFGHYDSHIILATHSGILTPIQSTAALAATSPRIRRSPTTWPHISYHSASPSVQLIGRLFCRLRRRHNGIKCASTSQASVSCLAPLYFPRRVTRPVSYYALF